MRKFGALLLFFFLTMQIAVAQSHELAVTVGGKFTSDQNFNIDPSFAVEGSYAGRLIHVPLAALYFELPVAAGLKSNSSNPNSCEAIISTLCNGTSFTTSALFVAPGVKLKLGPELQEILNARGELHIAGLQTEFLHAHAIVQVLEARIG